MTKWRQNPSPIRWSETSQSVEPTFFVRCKQANTQLQIVLPREYQFIFTKKAHLPRALFPRQLTGHKIFQHRMKLAFWYWILVLNNLSKKQMRVHPLNPYNTNPYKWLYRNYRQCNTIRMHLCGISVFQLAVMDSSWNMRINNRILVCSWLNSFWLNERRCAVLGKPLSLFVTQHSCDHNTMINTHLFVRCAWNMRKRAMVMRQSIRKV
jgi:hypothetical protein